MIALLPTMNKPLKKEIILGIDPGLASTGYGVIKKEKNKITLVNHGCISTSSKESHPIRLQQIHDALKKIIKKFRPNIVATEQLFFAKNVKTALKIGEVRGVIQFTCIECKIPVQEFTPLQIKQALTGYGRADKNQIAQLVKQELNLKDIPKPDHAADALATAITCAYTQNKIQ